MARAKRTDRAEARRRYRATLVDDLQPDDRRRLDPSDAEATASRRARRRTAQPRSGDRASRRRPPGPASSARVPLGVPPIDLRGDIAALPSSSAIGRSCIPVGADRRAQRRPRW